MEETRKKWLIFSAVGLAVFGFGLSLMGEALIKKYEADTWQDWFWIGTAALIVTNTGLALFGKAVVLRVRLDQMKKD
jgi:membrane protein DedA with SNARE-associated domain